MAELGTLKLVPRPGNVPNSAHVNWGNQVALVGYDLDTRIIRPGEAVSVTLYWQALAPMKLGIFSEASDRLPIIAPDGNPVSGQKLPTQVRVADK